MSLICSKLIFSQEILTFLKNRRKDMNLRLLDLQNIYNDSNIGKRKRNNNTVRNSGNHGPFELGKNGITIDRLGLVLDALGLDAIIRNKTTNEENKFIFSRKFIAEYFGQLVSQDDEIYIKLSVDKYRAFSLRRLFNVLDDLNLEIFISDGINKIKLQEQ